MSLTPTFTTHPRALQRIRDYTPAVGAVPNFLCKRCGQKVYQFAGRKKVIGGGWKCASCAKGEVCGQNGRHENAGITGLEP